jgi:hypothetical protein
MFAKVVFGLQSLRGINVRVTKGTVSPEFYVCVSHHPLERPLWLYINMYVGGDGVCPTTLRWDPCGYIYLGGGGVCPTTPRKPQTTSILGPIMAPQPSNSAHVKEIHTSFRLFFDNVMVINNVYCM